MHVLIVDDHPTTRTGYGALLAELSAEVRCTGSGSVQEALSLVHAGERFDLVLLDMNLPGVSRIDGLVAMRRAIDGVPIVVISGEKADRALVTDAIENGASGYLPKTTSIETQISALKHVLARGIYLPEDLWDIGDAPGDAAADPRAPAAGALHAMLSHRQRDVLLQMLQGKSNKLIARELDIAEGTVKAHLWAIYQLLGVRSRTQAMARVHALGLVEPVDAAGPRPPPLADALS